MSKMAFVHLSILFSALSFTFASLDARRFLLYDVNSGEGFNLRRDVYMRIANTVRQLREDGHNFVLVLPPWGPLYHWRARQVSRLKWKELFDAESLANFLPVIEFEDYLKEIGSSPIDLVLYLQHYAEGWSEASGFELKYDIRPCLNDADSVYYLKNQRTGDWSGRFFGYEHVLASDFKCLSIQGQSSTLVKVILEQPPEIRSIFIDRAEVILHDLFGDTNYWSCRASMNYSPLLRKIADQFRNSFLDDSSSPQRYDPSRTKFDEKFSRLPANSGGSYLCAHLRRADFVQSHHDEVPSIAVAVKQIRSASARLNLSTIFVATDANATEIDELDELLRAEGLKMVRFTEVNSGTPTLSLPAISIIDQWICAHARHFIGTHQSTFSYRIHEDRELLGFPIDSTFNRFCGDKAFEGTANCEQPARWTLVQEEATRQKEGRRITPSQQGQSNDEL